MLDYAPQAQRVTISATPHTNSGTWSQHGKYLQRDGAQLSQEHGRGWGADGDIELVARLTEWKEAGETLLHKIVISPESSRGVDLRDFTAALVSRIEQDTGQQLAWCAIEHHNTKHDHVHLLVRGTARGGAPLRLSSAYLRTELQAFAAERLPIDGHPRLPLRPRTRPGPANPSHNVQ
jgi:type IV secretory pathway VirD2 relaxase